MHSQLTPFRICRLAIFGLVISLVLMVLAFTLPFYSYAYFLESGTMTLFGVADANKQILIPIIMIITAFVFDVCAIIFMLFLSKKKIVMAIGKGFSLASAFIFLGVFIISICRLWVIPYEFDYLAYQTLDVGYIIYVLFLLYSGVLSCYILGIHEK